MNCAFIMKNIYKHIFWWFAFQFIAIFNAALREFIYKKPHIFYIIIRTHPKKLCAHLNHIKTY